MRAEKPAVDRFALAAQDKPKRFRTKVKKALYEGRNHAKTPKKDTDPDGSRSREGRVEGYRRTRKKRMSQVLAERHQNVQMLQMLQWLSDHSIPKLQPTFQSSFR